MDLQYTSEQNTFRSEAREWLRAHVPKKILPHYNTKAGWAAHRDWEQTLHKDKWGMVTWPEHLGGRDKDLLHWLIFEEEYYRAGAPFRINQNGICLFGSTLMEYGTEKQKERFLPKMVAAQEIWAQAWSEPTAGSDMASIRSTARRDGDGLIINGHKIWSSRGVCADWLFGIFRTDPDSERHRGLSYIVVPCNTKGVTIRPIEQLDGLPGFAEIFFEDVHVDMGCLIGEIDQGWNIAMATAGFERGLLLRSPARFQETARRLVALYQRYRKQADNDPSIHDSVMNCWMRAEAYNMMTYATVSRLLSGRKLGSETSTNKVFWSELDREMHETAMSILDTHAMLGAGASEVVDDGAWLEGYLFSLGGPIYAGSNEIQRNIVAERMLGMPR
jgi:alkylation response protein AidB-like acyl-CoA dehydrogenase